MHNQPSLSNLRWDCKYHILFGPKYRNKTKKSLSTILMRTPLSYVQLDKKRTWWFHPSPWYFHGMPGRIRICGLGVRRRFKKIFIKCYAYFKAANLACVLVFKDSLLILSKAVSYAFFASLMVSSLNISFDSRLAIITHASPRVI